MTRVVPVEQLLGAARVLAADLIANSPVALAATKRLLTSAGEAEVSRGLELAIAENAAIRQTADFREGLAAFLEAETAMAERMKECRAEAQRYSKALATCAFVNGQGRSLWALTFRLPSATPRGHGCQSGRGRA